MSTENWIQFAIAMPPYLGFLWVLVVWSYRKGSRAMAQQVAEILKEVKPNGGNSMNDRVCRLEHSQRDQTAILNEIKQKLGI